jgi:hypothetical protein
MLGLSYCEIILQKNEVLFFLFEIKSQKFFRLKITSKPGLKNLLLASKGARPSGTDGRIPDSTNPSPLLV